MTARQCKSGDLLRNHRHYLSQFVASGLDGKTCSIPAVMHWWWHSARVSCGHRMCCHRGRRLSIAPSVPSAFLHRSVVRSLRRVHRVRRSRRCVASLPSRASNLSLSLQKNGQGMWSGRLSFCVYVSVRNRSKDVDHFACLPEGRPPVWQLGRPDRSRRTMTAQSLVFSAVRYNGQDQFSNGLRKTGVRGVVCATVTVFAHWGGLDQWLAGPNRGWNSMSSEEVGGCPSRNRGRGRKVTVAKSQS